jgi:hypothetical protein
LAESAKLAIKDEKFEDTISIYAAAVISNDHNDGIDDQKKSEAASESPLAEKWYMVMEADLDAIGHHQVFGDFVQRQEGRKVLPSHWVYMIKRDGAGNVQWFKARLVWAGNHQIAGIDYQAQFALTAHLGHVMVGMVIAAKNDLELHPLNTCIACLGVDLEEVIYLHPLKGFFRLLQTVSQYYIPTSMTSLRMVLCSRRSLYAAEQSWHVWYGTFEDVVLSTGFMASRLKG